MLQNNEETNLNRQDNIHSSVKTTEENEQLAANGNDTGNTHFTEEEIKNANKPQPNVILNKADGSGQTGTGYRDNERVNERANEASDSTDTNTGGIVSGAAKGASQS